MDRFSAIFSLTFIVEFTSPRAKLRVIIVQWSTRRTIYSVTYISYYQTFILLRIELCNSIHVHYVTNEIWCLICLFVCLFFVPLKNFSLIWRRHYWRWRAANFDLCSALMAIKQWVFFSMPHLHVYCDTRPGFSWSHPIWLVTFTPFTKCLGVELSLPVLTT